VHGADEVGGSAEDVHPSDPEVTRTAALAAKKQALKRKFDEQYDDPSLAAPDFYTEKK
jgi:ribosome biogenesis protein BMS1